MIDGTYVVLAVFAFATLGSKVILGLVAVYVLLPRDRRCPICDRETRVLLPWRGLGPVARLLRIERRWCIACDHITLMRGRRGARLWVGRTADRTRDEAA